MQITSHFNITTTMLGFSGTFQAVKGELRFIYNNLADNNIDTERDAILKIRVFNGGHMVDMYDVKLSYTYRDLYFPEKPLPELLADKTEAYYTAQNIPCERVFIEINETVNLNLV